MSIGDIVLVEINEAFAARRQNTMLNSLDWHDKTTGLITMCVGGGQGMALTLERLS